MKRVLLAGFAALALAFTGACAGDDADVDADLSADTNADEGSVEEYCEFAAELDSREEVPSDEDLDRIVDLAPEEIKDDVETLADAIKEGDMESDEATAAGERLEAWEDDNCPQDDAGDSGDADSGGGGDDADASEDPADGESGEGGGDSGSGNQGTSQDDGGAEAEVEAEVGGDEETTTTR